MASNWVGFACGYASYGAVQWRLPLALQIPWGIILFIGLAVFMPDSPRSLIQKGDVERARRAFFKARSGGRLGQGEDEAGRDEFEVMRLQIEAEMQRENLSYGQIFTLFRHRVLVYVL